MVRGVVICDCEGATEGAGGGVEGATGGAGFGQRDGGEGRVGGVVREDCVALEEGGAEREVLVGWEVVAGDVGVCGGGEEGEGLFEGGGG